MDAKSVFDPKGLEEEEKNELLKELYGYASNYPAWLSNSTPYSCGYRAAAMLIHDNLCEIFGKYSFIQNFDPND